YGLYVLARNARPVMGDLRYLADNKLKDFATPLAKGQIGAALALLGDRGRSRRAFDEAVTTLTSQRDERIHRVDYGSKLRDGGGLMALIAEADADRALLMRASAEVETSRQSATFTSTQEQMWLVLAAQALARDAEGVRLTVNGAPRPGALYRNFREAELEAAPVAIANTGDTALRVVVTVSGAPLSPLPPLDRGYRVERTIHAMNGKPANWGALRQNERYVVHLKVTEPKATAGRLLLVDPLPAGLEIENPSLGDGVNTEGLAFTKTELTPTHVEARDDRFVAAFDRAPEQKPEFTASYVVRAVTPGRYVHPGAAVEDMYVPERFGRGASASVEVQSAR
ncbi:MAG: alpha-2-macroglobulin family protein, partial [Beijerinckiaceae bacterium]